MHTNPNRQMQGRAPDVKRKYKRKRGKMKLSINEVPYKRAESEKKGESLSRNRHPRGRTAQPAQDQAQ
jgi:hypothetical protein